METQPQARRIRTGAAAFVIDGVSAVRPYRDVFEEYRMHPESKAAGDRGRQCAPWTVGQLQPLVVGATGVVRKGKETNRLAEDLTVLDDPDDRAIEYPERTCRGCGAPLHGRERDWCSEACRKRAGRHDKSKPQGAIPRGALPGPREAPTAAVAT
jgi:hypothetical protein